MISRSLDYQNAISLLGSAGSVDMLFRRESVTS